MRNIYPKLLYGFVAVLLFCGNLSAQKNNFNEYRPLLVKNVKQLGISVADVNDAIITNAYTDDISQVTYIYLQQAYRQVKVYNTIITATFSNGSFLYSSGNFVKDIAAKAGNATPAKLYTDAVIAAARHLGLPAPAIPSTLTDLFSTEKKYTVTPAGIAKRNIDVTLCWTPSGDKQQVTLTWNVNIDVKGSDDWWNVRIDAQTNNYVQKDNWTVHEQLPANGSLSTPVLTPNQAYSPAYKTVSLHTPTAIPPVISPKFKLQAPPPNVTSSTYRVIPFPAESPLYSSFANVNNPWLMAGTGNNAITLGWHFDSVDNYTITRGNNVFAFLDRQNNNTSNATRNWPDTSSTAAPSLTFVHNQSVTEQPLVTENKKAALDNLFYWNNIMHDISYQYGFTESAGNFQRENLGRGGIGNDFVNANAQDSAGYSNANFSTPIEGTNGRMQMYLFTTIPSLNINSPSTIAGSYSAREGSFTAPNRLIYTGTLSGQVVYYNDDASGSVHNGCTTTGPVNATAIAGKIALIDASSGSCTIISRVRKAQTAGAIGVLLYYPTLATSTGTDNTVTIPAAFITTADANSIIAQLNNNVPVSVTLSSGIYKDGDLDNGIICHEYTHGISNRLTGGPYGASCLGNAEQGGEGWSDYVSLMVTTNWATTGVNDGVNKRPIGNYVLEQGVSGAGIRRYPYSTDLTIDPLTYANVATSTEVHNIGEVWCSALWDMTWNIIQQAGNITPNLYNSNGTGGNTIAMKLVMTGMKLQPCSPGFLDARDAILAADSILYGNVHKCAIWNAFARRGMGYSASQGLSTSATDQTPSYDVPSGIQANKPLPQKLIAGTQNTITHTVDCGCQPYTGIVVRDTIPTGFTYVRSTPSGTLNGNILSFPATDFASSETKNFSIVLQAPATGCTVDSVLNDNRDGSTTGGFISSGTSAWSVSSSRSYSGTNSWFAPNLATVASASLTSSATFATAQQPLSILSFWHNYRTETKFDGGVVEYSIDGGTNWIDAKPLFMLNPYNTAMDASTTLSGRTAFSGNSEGFIPSVLNLSSLGTTPVQFRFRLATDNGVGVEGWYVDDILRTNGCGGILKTGMYNAGGTRLDTLSQPLFVVPGTPGLWTGNTSTDYSVASNWSDNVIPGATSNITIPTGVTNMPVLSTVTTLNNVTLQANTTLSLNGQSFTINGILTGPGLFIGSATSGLTIGGTGPLGTLNFSQSSDGTTNALASFTMNRTSLGTASLGNKLVLLDTYIPLAGVLTTGSFLTLRSTATKTARIASGTGTYITGNVTVQRYIPARRAWRLMNAPLTASNTINESLQNGGTYTPGVGTFITGTGTGFDGTNSNPSLKTFNSITQLLDNVTNTNVALSANPGYFLFVRGDRNPNNLTPPNTSITTLSATGALIMGSTTSPVAKKANASIAAFTLIGNPYMSPINWTLVTKTNTADRFYVWDPKLGSVGGYVLFDAATGYTPTVSGGSYTAANTTIESSQAFFVESNATAADGSLGFAETNKVAGNQNVFRQGNGTAEKLNVVLKAQQEDNSYIPVDGVFEVYENSYSAAVTGEDAGKLDNFTENLSIVREGKKLSIEKRPLVDNNDTIFLKLESTTQRKYQFYITPSDFNAPLLNAYLEDAYLHTSIPVSLSSNTTIDFSITGDVASFNPDRFKIVFKLSATLPISGTNVKAYQKNAGIQVDWNIITESSIRQYEVEKSADGVQFTKTNETAAIANNNGAVSYGWFDANAFTGNNYYRIKVISSNSSAVKYSSVVNVKTGIGKSSIAIYPNPVKDRTLSLELTNQAAGKYMIQLFNALGQQVFIKTIEHSGGSATQTIQLSSMLGKGVYQLHVSNGDNKLNQQVIIE